MPPLVIITTVDFHAFPVALSFAAVFSKPIWIPVWKVKTVESRWKLDQCANIVAFKNVSESEWIRNKWRHSRENDIKGNLGYQGNKFSSFDRFGRFGSFGHFGRF